MAYQSQIQSTTAADNLVFAYESLKNADIQSADSYLENALKADFEHPEVLLAMKCMEFWKDQLSRMPETKNLLDRGDFLCASWKKFMLFLSRIGDTSETVRYAYKRFVFGLALDQYLALPDEEKDALGAALDLRLGRARKATGDIETALIHLERAMQAQRNDAEVLAELADAYAMAGEARLSKALFREAFFLDPLAVGIEYLESEFILKIIENIQELGYSGNDIAEWIPVYAEIWGVFNVKRELSAAEYNRISASARQLEIELRESPQRRSSLVPGLLNRYFWMADHLKANGDEAGLRAVLLKIKILDQSIYASYIG
jgi:tetratricopeptide (TPR) repeat protein